MGASLSKTVLGMGQEECYENYRITRYAKWLLIWQEVLHSQARIWVELRLSAHHVASVLTYVMASAQCACECV